MPATISRISGVDVAATGGIITNVIFAVLSLLSIIAFIPGRKSGKKAPQPTGNPTPGLGGT